MAKAWTRSAGLKLRPRTDVGVRLPESAGLNRTQRDFLAACQSCLRQLGHLSIPYLMIFRGVSPEKAMRLISELYELGCIPGRAKVAEYGGIGDDDDDTPSIEEQAEIESRIRAVRAAKQRRRAAGLLEACTQDELDAILPPTNCARTRNRLARRMA